MYDLTLKLKKIQYYMALKNDLCNQTKLKYEEDINFVLLEDLWKTLMPGVERTARQTKQWIDIGFQG